MKNIWLTVVSGAVLLLLLALAGCALVQSEQPVRIALLGPFEGRYREIGYNALYAVRLALAGSGQANIELLAVDDGGGAPASAADRARALQSDPRVLAVIALGYDATTPDVQAAFGDLTVIIAGNWLAEPTANNIFILSSAEIQTMFTETERIDVTRAARIDAPFTGGEILALNGFRQLRTDFDGLRVISSGSLADDDFRQRYRESDLYAPEPGLLATTVYDAAGMAAAAIAMSGHERSAISDGLAAMTYSGINGSIRFEDGYWAGAPINSYVFTSDGHPIPEDGG
jgi:ABC-type branched-subunit amino acid transport system substrate-binding protein